LAEKNKKKAPHSPLATFLLNLASAFGAIFSHFLTQRTQSKRKNKREEGKK